jgi:Peptidase family C25
MKLSVVFVTGFLLLNSVLMIGMATDHQTLTHRFFLSFEKPILDLNGSTVTILMDGAPACRYQPGQPVLPMYTTTLELPFGSRIQDVSLQFDSINTLTLEKRVTTAPYPYIQATTENLPENTVEENTSNPSAFCPLEWFTYSTGAGLNQDSQHVTFFTLRVYPARYQQSTNTLVYLDFCNITITYETMQDTPFPNTATNDLVIICPTQFFLPLLQLAEYKNIIGIRTQIITLAEIYRNYPGFDRPEQIKYCIKNVVENWGTTYVLLVGGLNSHLMGKPRDNLNTGTRDWRLPVRYTNLWDDDTIYDPGFISDLYYADIYDSQGSFCTWDSFGDGIYGGWSHSDRLSPPEYPLDQIDFYPDVYLGRLPCRTVAEVKCMVSKIISYEKTSADPSWFQKIVVVAGDPYDDQGTNYPEGELIGEKAVSYLPGFDARKLFASYRDTNPKLTPLSENIIREINQGCGFLFFDGHGGPTWWNTFWPGEFDSMIQQGGLSVAQFPQIRNGDWLPVCIIGGCHNNLFNVSLLSTVTDPRNKRSSWSNGIPTLECWGWSLTVKKNGGAIATIGNTGLGLEAGGEVGDLNGDGVNEPDCIESLCGYLETQFFKSYQTNQIKVLGKAWCHTIAEYLRVYPGMDEWSDAKTLEQWILFGDPSLRIGGYP